MKQKNMMELLAPAGSADTLRAVVNAGADAVYIGAPRFGARAYAELSAEEELLAAIDYAHLHGVRVHLTVNTLVKNEEIDDVIPFLLPYAERGVDAVIVQDFGLLKRIHAAYPTLPIHASTQMFVTGGAPGPLLKKYGVERIVAARECSLRELEDMKRTSGLAVEAFIHGALCVCYSGQCLFSSLLGGRSGNRGRCAQPCRLLYRSEGGRSGELLSMKDLCTLEHLPDFQRAGVSSLKIEGRMKQAAYASGVVSVYRKYLDLLAEKGPEQYRVDPGDMEILRTLFERDGFTDGYLYRHNDASMNARYRTALSVEKTRRRNDLYREFDRLYSEGEHPVSLSGEAWVTVGDPVRFAAESSEGIRAEAEGQAAEAASGAPLTGERIREKLSKSGGSGFVFRDLSVHTDGGSFLPVSALNSLRRQTLTQLGEAMLSGYRRNCENAAVRERETVFRDKALLQSDCGTEKREEPGICAFAETAEQALACLSVPGLRRLGIPEALLFPGPEKQRRTETSEPEKADFSSRLLHLCREKEVEPWIVLPYVERIRKPSRAIPAAGKLVEAGAEGFYVRSLQQLALLAPKLPPCRIHADAGLYSLNTDAQAFLRENGCGFDTASYESSAGELRSRINGTSELPVYGRIPMMVTAQCLRKNEGHCTGKEGWTYLVDRKGIRFPVQCSCSVCCNVIYNSLPLDLTDEGERIERLGFGFLRFSFTDESPDQARGILSEGICRLREKGKAGENTHRTKGHFRRGVE